MSLDKKLKISDIEDIFAGNEAGMEDFFNEFSVLLPVVERDGRLMCSMNLEQDIWTFSREKYVSPEAR